MTLVAFLREHRPDARFEELSLGIGQGGGLRPGKEATKPEDRQARDLDQSVHPFSFRSIRSAASRQRCAKRVNSSSGIRLIGAITVIAPTG